MVFHNKLINWYLNNKRKLPWRETTDPYAVWLSEIILQQTKIAQGMAYYFKFMEQFPTVFSLAKASEQEVLKLWQGLGYYSRARNLHATAKIIVENYGGLFPVTYKELIKLKGVGDYTASAISSFCFGEPQAVVDGNVYRVLSRVFGIDTPINSSKGIKEFRELAQELMDTSDPGTYNQAVMEFGSLYCKPRNPHCHNCIFITSCRAFAENKVDSLPVKINKVKVKKRYFNYLFVLSDDDKTILNQRKGSDIWQNLYHFPLIETSENLQLTLAKIEGELNSKVIDSFTLCNEEPVIHKLSHQHLSVRFWIVKVPDLNGTGIPVSEISKYPVPVLIANFIKEFDF